MPELADIFRLYGPDYIAQFGADMLPSHKRAIQDIIDCRTPSLGGHTAKCNNCGHEHESFHSCRNRSCPKCHSKDTNRWLEKRRLDLLPVLYYHLVLTLPQQLRHIVRSHQKILYDVLIKAAASSIMKLAADPHYVGGQIALLSVLHTWTQTLIFHPHVHCLVPAGGLLPDNSAWLAARNDFLVPIEPLSIIYRAKFMHMARKALPDVSFPDSVWHVDWVVKSKSSIQGADKVLDYLARYVHRIAITNNRIVSIDNGDVTFRYKDRRDLDQWKPMTLPAQEFIRRFIQHVLPKGFHKVRYYALLSSSNKKLFQQVQSILTDAQAPEVALSVEASPSEGADSFGRPPVLICSVCHIGLMIVLLSLPRRERAPP